jgi:hypothetical protein
MSRMYQLCFVGIAMMALLVPMQKSHAVIIVDLSIGKIKRHFS